MSLAQKMELPPLETTHEISERSPFGTVITAMITPFDSKEDRVVNITVAQRVASFLESSGSEGLVVAGTTGESPALSFGEQIMLIEAITEAVDIPVIAGTGANTTKEAVSLTEQAAQIDGVDALLVVSPYYNRPPQMGIKDYYEQVAMAADDKPVIMYDIPARTGRAVATETILDLAGVKNIVGVKVASGNPGQTATIKRERPEFLVYSGDDALNLRHFGAGADGAISVVSHWAPRLIKQMWEAKQLPVFKDKGRARAIDALLQESYDFASSDETPNPVPVKAMMRYLLGNAVGYCQSPMSNPDINLEGNLQIRASKVYDELLLKLS